jgi:FkbM family methyltransferase
MDKNLSLNEKKNSRTPLWDSNINWDALTTEIFVKNHKPSWNYCDVGSCQGLFSNLFVELAKPNGKVFAFEIYDENPIIPNTIFERIAISDKVGTEIVYESSEAKTHTSNILGHDVGYNESSYKCEIPCTTLDEYFKDKSLDCIKIDIEGAELKAIKGGLETFKKCKLIVIECHLDEDWKEIYTLLTDNNFNFKNLSSNESISIDHRPYLIYHLND